MFIPDTLYALCIRIVHCMLFFALYLPCSYTRSIHKHHISNTLTNKSTTCHSNLYIITRFMDFICLYIYKYSTQCVSCSFCVFMFHR